MGATLVERPFLAPKRCIACTNGGAMSGPYLDTDKFSMSTDERIYLCHSCTVSVLRAVDKVDKKEYIELSRKHEGNVNEVIRLQEACSAKDASIAKLEKRVAAAEVAKINAEHVLVACQNELKKAQREPTADLRRQLMTKLDEQTNTSTAAPKTAKSKKTT